MFKSALKFQIITIICQALSFFGSWQIAHYLSIYDRGALGKNLLYITLILAIGNSGYNEYVSRAVKEGLQINFSRIILSGSVVSSILITIAFLLGLIDVGYVNLVFLYFILFFYYYSVLSQTYMWGKGYDVMMLVMRVITALFLPVSIFILYVLDLVSDQWFLFGTFSVYLLLALIHFLWQKKTGLRIFEFKGRNDMNILFYNSLSTILLMIIFNIDKLVISSVVTTEIYAKYLIAIAIFSPVSELMASISSVIIIKIDKSQNVFRKIMLLLGAYLLILLFVGNVLVYLLPIVFGEKYSDSIHIAKLFPLMFFFIVSFRILDSLLRVYNLKASSLINGIGLTLFMLTYIYGKYGLSSLSIQDLSIMLTTTFGLIALSQVFIYYKYGRAAK